MAQFYTNFSGYTTGQQPSDWTNQWDDFGPTYTIIEDASYNGGKAFDFSSNILVGDTHIWDSKNGSDVEVATLIETGSEQDNTITSGPAVRVSGSSNDNGDCYFAAHSYEFGFREFQIYKISGGTPETQIGSSSSSLSQDSRMWIRLRVNGTTIRAKHWLEGNSEPGSWDIDITDSDISSGDTGVIHGRQGSSSDNIFDEFGVGTSGDTAPMESTGQTFTQTLEERTSLVK